MSEKYKMQVLVGGVFKDVGMKGKPPYTYDTREEAENMLRICYPDQLREDKLAGTPGAQVRVVPADTTDEKEQNNA